MLKVHQEVVVELDEEVALLERRQRDSLLELHRELMPQLALVEAPELGEELGELGLLARLPVEERVNLSGAAHRSRLDRPGFPTLSTSCARRHQEPTDAPIGAHLST